MVRYEGGVAHIANHAPTLDFILPRVLATGVTFTAVGRDQDANDVLTYSLIGAPASAVIDPRTGEFSWLFDQVGTFKFTVRVTDAGGLFAEQSVTLYNLRINHGELIYVGTPGRDAMIFEEVASGEVAVYRDGTPLGTFTDVKRVVAHGLGGNDVLAAVGAVPVEFFGGAGRDSLRGGGAADLLSGGQGTDLILGGAGADQLLGGSGADILIGGRGNDLLFRGAGDYLIDDSELSDSTSITLERILGRRIWDAAAGCRIMS